MRQATQGPRGAQKDTRQMGEVVQDLRFLVIGMVNMASRAMR